MSEPQKRVIDGCRHQLERMTEWANQGACPVCLTAQLGTEHEQVAALIREVEKETSRPRFANSSEDYEDHGKRSVIDRLRVIFGASPVKGATK